MAITRVREASEWLEVSDDTTKRWIDRGGLLASHARAHWQLIAGEVAPSWRTNASNDTHFH